jgi:hypothetical protein
MKLRLKRKPSSEPLLVRIVPVTNSPVNALAPHHGDSWFTPGNYAGLWEFGRQRGWFKGSDEMDDSKKRDGPGPTPGNEDGAAPGVEEWKHADEQHQQTEDEAQAANAKYHVDRDKNG